MWKIRFYCLHCHKFRRRKQVELDQYEFKYYCKECEEPVIQTRFVVADLIKDFIEYQATKKDMEDYQ